MPIDFAGGSVADQITHGSAAGIDDQTTVTYCFWVYHSGTAGTSRLWQKGYVAAHSMFRYIETNTSSGVMTLEIDRATTSLIASVAMANFAAWGTGKWVFIAANMNTGGANGDQRLLVGDLTTPCAEPSSYTSQSVGSGAVKADAAADWIVGNRGGSALSWYGRVAFHSAYNRALTNGELWNVQFSGKLLTGALIHSWYDNASAVKDWSGNGNHGTVTGATTYTTASLPVSRGWGRANYLRYAAAASGMRWHLLSGLPYGSLVGGRLVR